MITFGSHHQAAFQASARETFIARTLEFLEEERPDWVHFTPDDEQRPYIENMLDLAHRCHLLEALSVQKLIHYHLEYDFPIPLQDAHAALLDRPGLDETLRLSQFVEYLTNDGTVKIVSVEELGKLYAEHMRELAVPTKLDAAADAAVGRGNDVAG